MTKVTVYDPAMCCSTGVCGPSVDPALARFSADLDWLASKGVQVTRYNLSQEPAEFAKVPAVQAALEQGTESLPLVLVDGEVVSSGKYPSRSQLAGWADVKMEPPVQAPSSSSCCGPDAGNGCCG